MVNGNTTDYQACDDDLATTVPGVFAAGEVAGTAGADGAELEGYLAGASAARHLGRLDPAGYAAHTRPLRDRLDQRVLRPRVLPGGEHHVSATLDGECFASQASCLANGCSTL